MAEKVSQIFTILSQIVSCCRGHGPYITVSAEAGRDGGPIKSWLDNICRALTGEEDHCDRAWDDHVNRAWETIAEDARRKEESE